MAIAVGTSAPDFKLFNSDKQEVSLSSLKGAPVVLHFFPAAFTGVCTTQLCTVRDDLSYYNNMNVKVFGISVDSLFVLGKFKEEQNYNFELLSDYNKDASTAFDVLYDVFPAFGMKNVAKRAAFVIDAVGNVAYAEECPTPGDLPNFGAIKACLDGLK
jgi:glutaredoxin-dependent peroxiredoxin